MNSDYAEERQTIEVSAATTDHHNNTTTTARIRGAFLAAAALSAVLTACGGTGSPTAETITATVTAPARTVTVTAAAPLPMAPPVPAGPAESFGDGTYQAGSDVAAGNYSTAGPRDGGCAYTYLPRKGAQLTEAEGGGSIFGPGYLELADGQIVQTIGCKTWRLDG